MFALFIGIVLFSVLAMMADNNDMPNVADILYSLYGAMIWITVFVTAYFIIMFLVFNFTNFGKKYDYNKVN